MRLQRIGELSTQHQSGSMAYTAPYASVGAQQRWHADRCMTMKVCAPYGQHRKPHAPYQCLEPGRTAYRWWVDVLHSGPWYAPGG